jgi:hypothetical protein
MARSDWILPRPDASCGRVFHPDRQTAEGYRIALEFWDQATGRIHPGHRLVAYRCKRCGGFHLVKKRGPSQPANEIAHEKLKPFDADAEGAGLGVRGDDRAVTLELESRPTTNP